nr:integrase, catalytic region, zinc finger, CCHC-type, peptidase aspartic, catalytic [Tanacetum cinerariifolium]
MKSLKEKVKDKLIKQDQSLQTLHMLCRPRQAKLNKVAIGYKSPLCLTRAKQIQPALYNGHEIIKDNHTPAIMHKAEDTLEIAEITRKKMNGKMNDPESQQRAKQLAYIPLIRKKQVAIANPSGVNSCPNASGSQPKSYVKPHRISPAKDVNKLPVEDQPRTNKSQLRTSIFVDSSSRLKRTIVLWYLDSGYSKHMTGDRSRLMNFVKKFIGIVRFGNDHFGAIMGYGDYVIGNSVISRVYYMEGLGHNLFSVGQFCDSDLKVAF